MCIRDSTYSVRYNYKDHAGKPCKGWETFKTKAEAQERKITVEKELLDGTFLVPNTMTVEEMPVSYTHLVLERSRL